MPALSLSVSFQPTTTVGITAFPASLIAGFLWQLNSLSAPFILGAALAGVAVVALFTLIQ